MTIYVIRHGQTDWNAEARLQGGQDIPLNALGRRQATENGRALGQMIGTDTDRFQFVSSPLGRARETMERVREAMGLDPKAYAIDRRLIEISFGDWEGLTLEEVEDRYPGVLADRDADKWHYLPPGERAESYEMLSDRVQDWLKSLNDPTVCVCHGGVMRTLFRMIEGLDAAEASNLPIHQDRIARIIDGRMAWL